MMVLGYVVVLLVVIPVIQQFTEDGTVLSGISYAALSGLAGLGAFFAAYVLRSSPPFWRLFWYPSDDGALAPSWSWVWCRCFFARSPYHLDYGLYRIYRFEHAGVLSIRIYRGNTCAHLSTADDCRVDSAWRRIRFSRRAHECAAKVWTMGQHLW